MGSAQYVGPHRGSPRALEQNELKYRAIQMILILFHAEELKNQVVDAAEVHARLMRSLTFAKVNQQEQPTSVQDRKRLERAFKTLIADGVMTAEESTEIKQLIGFRHAIAHDIDELMADLSNERWAQRTHSLGTRHTFNYEALTKLKRWQDVLSRRTQAMHRATSVRMGSLNFQAAERTFEIELKRLDRTIQRQIDERNAEIAALNAEMDLRGSELVGEFSPRHPNAHYDNGRLTKLGVEICYRLFDLGKSTLAVAHLTNLSLDAARHRKKLWKTVGGIKRSRIELQSIPRRKFYVRYDD